MAVHLPVIQKEKPLEMRPHHVEGALKAISAVLQGWDEINGGLKAEPEKVLEMFFDAEDDLLNSTSEATKAKIKEKWANNPAFQKVHGFLEERFSALRQEQKAQRQMFVDAAAFVSSSTTESEQAKITERYKDDDGLWGYVLEEVQKERKRLIENESDTEADQTLAEAAKTKETYSNPDQSILGHREMYQGLKEAFDKDPAGATVTLRNDFDFICKGCVNSAGERPCLASLETAGNNGSLLIDKKVAEAHNWELDKPYPLKDLLPRLITEATRRRIFMICNEQAEKPEEVGFDSGIWSKEVRESKQLS